MGTVLQQPASRLRPFQPVPFGRYTLLAHLAAGGMGDIFLARADGPKGFEKLCAIKKLLPGVASEQDFLERFIGEARTLAKLQHGSIAQVLDMGLHKGEPYLALEYVDGKDLRKIAARMRERGTPAPTTAVLFIIGRVLDALAYAHRKKDDDDRELSLVHRDVSPQNILVSYEGEVKVIDFGLAKSILSSATTHPSMLLGKFLYMSPEQAQQQRVDRRSDLYSVGLCLYELLSGKNPFEDVPPGELINRVAAPEIAPLHEVVPNCPAPVSRLVMKALAADPAERFQSAEEFRGRLLAALVELDELAGPEAVSSFMRETFAAEYAAERRLLVELAEAEAQVEEPRARSADTGVHLVRRIEEQAEPTPLSVPAVPDAVHREPDEIVTELDVRIFREGPEGLARSRTLTPLELTPRAVEPPERGWPQRMRQALEPALKKRWSEVRTGAQAGWEWTSDRAIQLFELVRHWVLIGLEEAAAFWKRLSPRGRLLLAAGVVALLVATPFLLRLRKTPAPLGAPPDGWPAPVLSAPVESPDLVPPAAPAPAPGSAPANSLDDIITPLAAPPKPEAPPARRKRPRAAEVKDPGLVQEWGKLRASFEHLQRSQPCEQASMKLLCSRYQGLKNEVQTASAEPPPHAGLVSRIRLLHDAVQQKRSGR